MSFHKSELAQRLAVVTAGDTIRGLAFNALLRVVRERLGEGPATGLRAPYFQRVPVDFFPYPARDFLQMLFTAADLLEPAYGSPEAALRAVGRATTDSFFQTGVGRTLSALIGRDVARLFSSAATAYATVVTHGTREVTPLGERRLRLVFKGDMQPVPYHEGMLAAGLGVIGVQGSVRGRAIGYNSGEYLVEWS